MRLDKRSTGTPWWVAIEDVERTGTAAEEFLKLEKVRAWCAR
jgi:hypothetical protein